MTVRLLDVNVLVSLLDSAHTHHAPAVAWFRRVAAVEGWATCPITENGLIRVVSQVSYPNLRLTPSMAAESLAKFTSSFSVHQFWADGLRMIDQSVFDLTILTGSRQITDVYLAGLAHRNGGRLTTIDGGVGWRAVRGADAALIERIPV
jgi:toxin-antitoxin system PIN domain toxin